MQPEFVSRVLCRGCCKVVTRFEAISGKIIKIHNSIYHIDCFKCFGCQATIGSRAAYSSTNGMTFSCRDCHLVDIAPKCHGCEKSTFEKCILAFDVHWHQSCFKCKACNKPLERQEYIKHEGFVYDEDCYYREVLKFEEKPIGNNVD